MKTIAISLSLIVIIICGCLIVNHLQYLDIPSNKNDSYAMYVKHKIADRTDIDECEKRVLQNQIDKQRKNDRQLSEISLKTQFTVFSIIVIQIIILVLIIVTTKTKKCK